MTKVARLNNIKDPSEFIDVIKDRDLLIYEDIQGSKIFVNYNGFEFKIKPKTLRSEPLNFIDLATQKFYNDAYFYFANLPEYVTELLNKNWWFCFEYFPDNQPANIQYSKVPKNNLILTCIVKRDKYIYDFDLIKEYSSLFDVETLPVLYKGKLSDKQLDILNLYLNTSDEDLEYVFGDENFAKFFYKLLNPKEKSSFLMNDGEFNDNMEKITIRIDNNDDYSFDIINPTYERIKIENSKYLENYSIILLSFLNYLQLVDTKNYKLKSVNKNEAYIEYVSMLFNDYFEENMKYINEWYFEIPSFFKNDKFKINNLLLKNEKTKEIIQTDDKYEYILKVLFGSFNKEKKKPFGVFDKQTISLFNNEVFSLNKKIEEDLKINIDYILQKSDIKNFTDFFNIKYNVDAGGEHYPDVYDELTKPAQEGSGKKKKKDVFMDKKLSFKMPPMKKK